MANLIEWTVPDTTEVSYDKVYIYRSSTKTGTYTNIASQSIADNEYFDPDGSDTDWYKVRFYNSTTGDWSAYSEPMQAQDFYGYCTTDDIRALTNITESDLSDTELYKIIKLAMSQINAEINVKVIRERVSWLDYTRENKINGINKVYYVKNWKGKYIADMDNDGSVDESDVIVYDVAPDGTETVLSVSSVEHKKGKITLSSAPTSGHELYITYCYSYVNPDPPNALLRLACTYLSAALAYAKLNIGKASQISLGNTRFYRHLGSYDKYYSMFENIINRINARHFSISEASVF